MTSPPRLRLVHDRRDVAAEGDDEPRGDAELIDDGRDTVEMERVADEATAEDAEEARARRTRALRLAVAGAVVFQALAVLHDAPRDFGYVAQSAVAPPAALAFPACLALYAATAWLAGGRARGGTRALFLVAAACMAIAVPFWGVASPITWPFELGGTLALAGAWLIHRERRAGLSLAGRDPQDGSVP